MTFIKALSRALALLILAAQTGPALAQQSGHTNAGSSQPIVVFETSMGSFQVVLNPKQAPLTVANFLRYVDEKYYDETIFHRVIEDFMIQGGGYTEFLIDKDSHEPVPNESDNGLKNQRGTIAMARTNDPDSATAQFYINVQNNDRLDFRPGQPGYTVFGRVILGMSVVDQISISETEIVEQFFDLPVEPVIIYSARRRK